MNYLFLLVMTWPWHSNHCFTIEHKSDATVLYCGVDAVGKPIGAEGYFIYMMTREDKTKCPEWAAACFRGEKSEKGPQFPKREKGVQ